MMTGRHFLSHKTFPQAKVPGVSLEKQENKLFTLNFQQNKTQSSGM